MGDKGFSKEAAERANQKQTRELLIAILVVLLMGLTALIIYAINPEAGKSTPEPFSIEKEIEWELYEEKLGIPGYDY